MGYSSARHDGSNAWPVRANAHSWPTAQPNRYYCGYRQAGHECELAPREPRGGEFLSASATRKLWGYTSGGFGLKH